MDRIDLTSSLKVSRFCMGCGPFGSLLSRDEAFRLMDRFAEAGGTFFDTAHVYAKWVPGGEGASERTLGEWIRARGMESRAVVGTKGGHPDLETMEVGRLDPESIASDLRESLERLGMERVALYWLHRDDPAVPAGEIIEALNEHVTAGWIGELGASNWRPARIRAANAYAAARGLKGFCASQIQFSYARANDAVQGEMGMVLMDDECMALHETTGMPVVPYSPQAGGFFSGRYGRELLETGGEDNPKVGMLRRFYFSEANFDRLERAQSLGRKLGISANAVALAWLMGRPFPSVPIIGPNRLDQLEDSLSALVYVETCRLLE